MRTSLHPLDALGNPVRRDILRSLRQRPRSVAEIAARFPVSRPAISRHLAILEEAGLVEARVDGAKHLYVVRLRGFRALHDFLDEFWDSAFARLEALARKDKDGG